MKKSWLLLFLLIIVISIAGCSSTSSTTSSPSSSSTVPNSISPNNKEIAKVDFCIGNNNVKYMTFNPPLVQYKTEWERQWEAEHRMPSSAETKLMMPIEPGKYKITILTYVPEDVVDATIGYDSVSDIDKFGNLKYSTNTKYLGQSNSHSNLNTEFIIPTSSINGKIILTNPFGGGNLGKNCGTIIVTQI